MSSLVATLLLPERVVNGVHNVCTSLIVNTICTSSTSIVSFIRYLSNSNHIVQDINLTIKEIDLEFTISIIKQVIIEQELKSNLTDSIKNAMIGVSETLKELNQELEAIHNSIKYHESKYFANWRTLVWHGNIDRLKKFDIILHKRYELLFALLKIYNTK